MTGCVDTRNIDDHCQVTAHQSKNFTIGIRHMLYRPDRDTMSFAVIFPYIYVGAVFVYEIMLLIAYFRSVSYFRDMLTADYEADREWDDYNWKYGSSHPSV